MGEHARQTIYSFFLGEGSMLWPLSKFYPFCSFQLNTLEAETGVAMRDDGFREKSFPPITICPWPAFRKWQDKTLIHNKWLLKLMRNLKESARFRIDKFDCDKIVHCPIK